MQGRPAGQRRSLNIGNNVVSVDDLYKVGYCCCCCRSVVVLHSDLLCVLSLSHHGQV